MPQIHLHRIYYFPPLYGNISIAWVEWCDTIKTEKRRVVIEDKNLPLAELQDWPVEIVDALRFAVENSRYVERSTP